MRIWSYYLTHILPTQMEMQIEFDVEADCQFLETLLLWPGLRLRIARDMHGRVVGFGIALPICRESLDLLADHPLVVLPCAYWDSTELATLPATAEAAEAYYLLHLAHTDWKPTAVSAALARDLVGLLALGGLFFVSTPFPKHKRLYEALGFDLVPSARTWAFGQAHPADGYVLDLRGIGVEAWLEAITSGQRSPQPRVPAESDRVLATVLFTDIVQSTERAAQLGDRRWRELLSAHNDLARRELDRFGGREVRTTGDGVLAIFDGPARGVQCASAMIEAVRSLGLSIRAGLHTGECELIGNDIGGIAVHIGARVAELAAPGEILVSSTVKDLIAGSGIQFEDRGIRTLRGVPGEWRLFRGVI
jgi:class 3 adenylate cyclase